MAKAARKKKEPVISKTLPAVTDTMQLEQPLINVQETPAPEQPVPVSPQPQNGVPSDPETKEAGQQLAPAVVTYEIVEAKFRMELTRLEYEKALQGLTSYQITEDNIAEAQNKLTRARRFLTQFEAIKSNGKEAALAETRMWDKAFNSLKKPIEDEITIKQKKLNDVAAEQARKKKAADNEEARKNGIKTSIDNFIIEQSQAIAGCKTNPELVNIQKLIGSHKAAKTRYEEFLPDLVTRCEALNVLIKEQKKTIDELEKLEKDKLEAEKTGDDATLIALEDKKDELVSKMEETKVVVQETAINQATKSESVEIARPHYNTIGARRSTWEWEVEDIKLLHKKMPHLVKIVPDEEKINDLLKTKKTDGSFKNVEEEKYFGLRFFLKKTY